jgi:hypothetical protein
MLGARGGAGAPELPGRDPSAREPEPSASAPSSGKPAAGGKKPANFDDLDDDIPF